MKTATNSFSQPRTLMVVLATSWLMLFAIQGCESKQNWETYLAAGRLQLEKGKVDVAERLFLEAYEEPETGDRTYFEPDKNSLLARSFRGLGHHYLLKDCNYEKALKNYNRALGLLSNQASAGPQAVSTLTEIALVYIEQDNYKEAEPILRRAITLKQAPSLFSKLKKQSPRDEYEDQGPFWSLAHVLRELGKFDEAEQLYLRELAIMDKDALDSLLHTWSGYTRAELAELYRRRGQLDKAERFFKEALAIMDRTGGAAFSALASALENYANTLQSLNRGSEASSYKARAEEIRRRFREQNEQSMKEGLGILVPCSEKKKLRWPGIG